MMAATFQSLLQNFFTDHLLRQRQASPHTIAGYRDTFRLLFRFATDQLGKTPSTVNTEDFQPTFIGRFLEHLEQQRGNSSRTRNARLAALHSFFRYVAVAEPAHASLCQQVLAMPSKRHQRKPIAFLDEAEIAAVLAAPDLSTRIGRRDRALLAVAIQTGLRVSELTDFGASTSSWVRVRTSGARAKDGNSGAHRSAATRRPPWTAGSDGICPARRYACFRACAAACSVATPSRNSSPGMHTEQNRAVHP
jgi:site-specific recombinase XerD